MSEEDIKRIEEELSYWQELADLLGWKVYGWTYKNSASFDTGPMSGFGYSSLTLTGNQRDDIMRAIRNAAATTTTIWP